MPSQGAPVTPAKATASTQEVTPQSQGTSSLTQGAERAEATKETVQRFLKVDVESREPDVDLDVFLKNLLQYTDEPVPDVWRAHSVTVEIDKHFDNYREAKSEMGRYAPFITICNSISSLQKLASPLVFRRGDGRYVKGSVVRRSPDVVLVKSIPNLAYSDRL
jgi:hypothetical protein